MSNHLIQPIDLLDINTDESLGLQCIKHGNTTPKWRTVSSRLTGGSSPDFETVLVDGEDGDKWAHATTSQFETGRIRYATSCLTQATLRFYLSPVIYDNPPEVWTYAFSLYINDVEIEYEFVLGTFVTGDPAQIVDYVVDLVALGLECRPCGNVWDIYFSGGTPSSSEDVDSTEPMTLEIVDVTF
jgi:hypothetical protein